MPAPNETFISVDVETAGPYPERYSLLSIGACLVDDPSEGFYIELKPAKAQVMESALHVSQLSIEKLSKEGVAPAIAMQQFTDWIRRVAPPWAAPNSGCLQYPFRLGFHKPLFSRIPGRQPVWP